MISSEPGGILYIVATPIGNLGDITYRAVDILKSVSIVAAEDTRHTRKLLNHYSISVPTVSYYEHNKFTRIPRIMSTLAEGNSVALVTDAGTPGISDPAYKLIRSAINQGHSIETVPGPSAAIAGLVVSGLPTDRFLFEGFLPSKKGRKARLKNLRDFQGTLIFFESPHRLVRTLNDIEEVIGERPAAAAREMTKLHEEVIRGTVTELKSHFTRNKPKGEFTLMVGKDDKNVYFA